MKKYLLLLCVVLPVAAASFAQDSLAHKKPLYKLRNAESPAARWVFKFAPLSFIDLDRTVQFGAEYIINSRLSLQQEVGYGHFLDWYRNTTTTTTVNGNTQTSTVPNFRKTTFRFRTELRYYFVSKYSGNPKGTYMAFEAFYKYANQPREEEVDQGSFFQTVRYSRTRNVLGGHFKMGWQFALDDRWLVDLYAGGGLRMIDIQTPGMPATARFLDESLFTRNAGTYTTISASCGFKIGYLVYKTGRNPNGRNDRIEE